MTGPFKMKGSPMKRTFGIGASPAKHTKEAAGFEHPHPHTEKEESVFLKKSPAKIYDKKGKRRKNYKY